MQYQNDEHTFFLPEEDPYTYNYTWFPELIPWQYNIEYYSTYKVIVEDIWQVAKYHGGYHREQATSSLVQSTIVDLPDTNQVGDTSTTTKGYYPDDLTTSSSVLYEDYVQELWEAELDSAWLYYEGDRNYNRDQYSWFNKYDYAEAHGFSYVYRENGYTTDEFPKEIYKAEAIIPDIVRANPQVWVDLVPEQFVAGNIIEDDVVELDSVQVVEVAESTSTSDDTWVLQVLEVESSDTNTYDTVTTPSGGSSTTSSSETSTSTTHNSTEEEYLPESGSTGSGSGTGSSRAYLPDSGTSEYSKESGTGSTDNQSDSTVGGTGTSPGTTHYTLNSDIGRDLANRFGITHTTREYNYHRTSTFPGTYDDYYGFDSSRADISLAYYGTSPVLGELHPYTEHTGDTSTTPSVESNDEHEVWWEPPPLPNTY
jgi:hypothetical protein